jgi:hypothetical protein
VSSPRGDAKLVAAPSISAEVIAPRREKGLICMLSIMYDAKPARYPGSCGINWAPIARESLSLAQFPKYSYAFVEI